MNENVPRGLSVPVDLSEPEPEVEPAAAAAGFAPTLDQWAQLLDRLAGNKEADMQMAATLHALAMKKALRPENEVAPDISVYNPTGGPRTPPRCPFMLGPYPICEPGDAFTTTQTEIALLNLLKPGEYMVTKSDATEVKLVIKADYDVTGTQMRKMTLLMPMADDEQKQNYPPLIQLLTEVVTGETPMKSFARMQARIAELEAQVAAYAAV